MKQFKIVVAGGREFTDFDKLTYVMDKLLINKRTDHKIIIVCGGARGADALGKQYAELRGYDVLLMKADWDKFGKSAGYRRNDDMAKVSQATVAFWDGKSRGTSHMIDLTKKYKRQLRVVPY